MNAQEQDSKLRGAIAWMASNPVAANLLMVIILAGGLIGLTRVQQEVFPEFSIDIVQVAVPYPGASPEDVEQGIVLAVEEAVRGLDGVKRVNSQSAEGLGTVSVELLIDADPEQVLNDVKGAVDRITSFPEEAEKPDVSVLAIQVEVISLVISGDQPLQTLQAIAEQARAELLARDGITQVEVYGVRPLEVAIEIPRETLEAHGLTLDEVARQVSAASLELPGGGVDTRNGELLVRVADRRVSGHEFADIVLRGTADGATLLLGDVATITDGYADTDQASYFNGKPAVQVTAYRVADETPMSVAGEVRAYADELRAVLPATVSVDIWNDDSKMLEGRIGLLVSNARIGLVLVVLVLALFLNLRLAFWVSLGIPISFLGTFLFLPGFDLSVNMITLFAFIVTLGLVVDDAIIVGENIYSRLKKGEEPLQAAIAGAREMSVPVTFSILTSIAAFAPMFFIPGVNGKVFSLIPAVVVLVLIFSLIESFFILPAHLAHMRRGGEPGRVGRAVARVQASVARGLAWHTDHVFEPALRAVLRLRYAAIAASVALLLVSVGVVASGVLEWSYFPKVPGDLVSASARLPFGAPIERTEAVQQALEQAVDGAIEEMGGRDNVRGVFTRVGEGPLSRGPRAAGSHLVTVEVSLVTADQREFEANAFADAWADRVPELAGVESLVFSSSTGPGSGAAVDVRLSHPETAVLADASREMASELRSFTALTAISNSYGDGKQRIDYRLREQARNLGLTSGEVASQLRSSFFGAEALREQRGRNELKVMVRLPDDQRRSEYDLEALDVRTPEGGFVPLAYVAERDRSQAPTAIAREDGHRVVNVTAELAPGYRSSKEVVDTLKEQTIPALEQRYPGLTVEFGGQQRDQSEVFGSLGGGYLLALLAIFALLAIPFRSYVQPLIIMSAIPFGLIGAVAGHLLMGYELSLISIFGLIALSGVVVNDSLVLIDAVNKRRADGRSAFEAVVAGARRRFRPILLTSLTTFFGLLPMIAEQSMQARFLVPMAISLGFGILFATFVILLIVPALYLALEDVRELVARWFGRAAPAADGIALDEVEAHPSSSFEAA